MFTGNKAALVAAVLAGSAGAAGFPQAKDASVPQRSEQIPLSTRSFTVDVSSSPRKADHILVINRSGLQVDVATIGQRQGLSAFGGVALTCQSGPVVVTLFVAESGQAVHQHVVAAECGDVVAVR